MIYNIKYPSMKVTRTSEYSGELHEMEVSLTEKQYTQWCHILEENVDCSYPTVCKAIPNITQREHEFLLNGITPEERAEIAAWEDHEPGPEDIQDYYPACDDGIDLEAGRAEKLSEYPDPWSHTIDLDAVARSTRPYKHRG